jgi:hypothetical protein
MLDMTRQALQAIANLDLQVPQDQEAAQSILRKAISIALNLSKHPYLQGKQLEMFP